MRLGGKVVLTKIPVVLQFILQSLRRELGPNAADCIN